MNLIWQKTTVVCLLLGMVCPWGIAGLNNPRLRIAVVDRASHPEAADMLTVTLSHQSNLVVLERQEVERILHEILLQKHGKTFDMLEVGRLLKADGLIILSQEKFDDKSHLVASLVSVDVGVRTQSFFCELPVKNHESWSKAVCDQLSSRFRKLDVKRDRAIAISALNLRMPVDTPETRRQEKEINLLLRERLLHQKEIFLLERQFLGRLKEEKNFFDNGGKVDFWTASFVVNGSLEADSKSGEKLALTLEIEKGGLKSPIQITQTGSKNNMALMVDQAVSRLISSIPGIAAIQPWKPEVESERFFKEAKSAHAAALYPEALEAAESSAALGMKSASLDLLLVRSGCQTAFSVFGIPGNLYSYHSLQTNGVASLDGVNLMIHAMDRCKNLLENQGQSPKKNHHRLGAEVLLTAGRVLAFYSGESRPFSKTEVEYLREKARQFTADVIRKFEKDPQSDFEYFFHVLAAYAPYFYEDPESVMRIYRYILKVRIAPSVTYGRQTSTSTLRKSLVYWRDKTRWVFWDAGDFRTPFLLPLNGHAQADCDKAWERFLTEQGNSPKLADQVDALLLRSGRADSPKEREKLAPQIEKFLQSHIEEISQDPIAAAAAGVLLEHELQPPIQRKILMTFLRTSDFWEEAMITSLPSGWDQGRFISMGEARELWGAMESYRKRVLQKPGLEKIHDLFQTVYQGRLLKNFPELAPSMEDAPLEIRRYWHPYQDPKLLSERGPLQGFSNLDIKFQEGSIWVSGNESENRIIRIDPLSWKASSIKPPSSNPNRNQFAVGEKYVFFSDFKEFFRMDRRTGVWKKIPIPPGDHSALMLMEDRVYLGISDYNYKEPSLILGFQVDTLEPEVLASSRRKPARSVLDDREPYHVMGLIPGGNHQLHALIGMGKGRKITGLYRYQKQDDEWVEVTQDAFQGAGPFIPVPSLKGTLFQSTGSKTKVVFLGYPSGKPERLLQETSPDRTVPGSRWVTHRKVEQVSLDRFPTTASDDGKTLYALCPRTDFHKASYSLACFFEHSESPVMVPLKFVLDEAVVHGKSPRENEIPRFINDNDHPAMLLTPSGFIFFQYGSVQGGNCGFWFLPREDLQRYLNARKDVSARTWEKK